MRDLAAVWSVSLPVGTVRLIEAFLEGGGRIDSVRHQLLDEYIERIAGDAVAELREAAEGHIDVVVATGGNIETLADLTPVPQAFRRVTGPFVAERSAAPFDAGAAGCAVVAD